MKIVAVPAAYFQFVTVKDFGISRNRSVVILHPGNIFCSFLLEIHVTSY